MDTKAYRPYPTSRYWRVEPTPKQAVALGLYWIRDLLFGGSMGSAKSIYLLMAASQFVDNPHHRALLIRQYSPSVRRPGGLLSHALEWWGGDPTVEYKANDNRFLFPSGASIEFGSLADGHAHHKYSGLEFTFIGIDESGDIPENQIHFLNTRLRTSRPAAPPRQLRLTANPGGISHDYHKRRFVDSCNTPAKVFLPASHLDNPHIDSDEYLKRFDGMHPQERAQLLGDWNIGPSTEFFDVDNIKEYAEIPADIRWARSWDLASTAPTKGTDPDYTVGALVGVSDGVFYVADIIRFRKAPAETERAIQKTAERDGESVEILVEQEPGSSGKLYADHLSRLLVGRAFYAIPATGSKEERARVLASAIRNGNVHVAPYSHWRDDLVTELRGFPIVPHDDQTDALSQAFGHLSRQRGFAFYFADSMQHAASMTQAL